MSQLIQSFFRDVRAICMTDNEANLIEHLNDKGLLVLKQLFKTEIYISSNPIECRDFGLFLIRLIPVCYSYVSDTDAEQALYYIPSINAIFNADSYQHSTVQTRNISETLDYLFNTIVHLFHIPSIPDNPTSEINTTHTEIVQAFLNLALPPLSTEYKILWYYQKYLRSLLLIFRQILSYQPLSYTNNFTLNPIGSKITSIYTYLSSSSSSTQFLIQFAFDTLQGFVQLIESTLSDLTQSNSTHRGTTNDLLTLLSQVLIGDYFPLFLLLNTDAENDFRSKPLLEHCSNLLRRLKIYRSQVRQRKHNRKIVRTSWENSYEQASIFHRHQNSLEITINNRNHFDGTFEIQNDNEENSPIARICVISAFYDKLLRLVIKQLDSNEPSLTFIQDCLSSLTSIGSCSCYSLSHYRTLLGKINHLRSDEKLQTYLEQQSIPLLRQAFLLISNCSQPNHHHHYTQTADNTLFWSYLFSHLFQRTSRYSLTLLQALPELLLCCSSADKQSALQYCITPTLEFYRSSTLNQESSNVEMIEYLVQTLPSLVVEITDDSSLITLSDTLVSLSSTFPSLLMHTLPVLGRLLTSASDSSNLSISESFLHLIIKLTNSWTLPHDGIENLCHILIILLQKCSTFRQAFYAQFCHVSLYERFRSMLTNRSIMQSSIIASTLVAVSYSPKSDFNYKTVLEHITSFSEANRSNQSWFELLVRLSLSQQYQDKRIRWKSSTMQKNQSAKAVDDESSTSGENGESTSPGDDDDEVYHGDVESLSDQTPMRTVIKQNQTIYSNLILFPELVILGLELIWQNVDHQWSDQQTSNRTSIYVTNLVGYLELLSSLIRANSYNCLVLKKLNIDGYLFTCLTKIGPRSSFIQKDTLISLIVTLLQFLWSQAINVNQLDQCFKLILTHPSLAGPLLRLFKHLVHQIDSNQPRSFCSMPLSSIVTAKGANQLRLTLEQLISLKYPPLENDSTSSPSIAYNHVRQSAFVTETLKTVQFQFPLTIALWLRVNYPFDKHDTNEENSNEHEETNASDCGPILHILTLHHEGIQLQFWLDSKPNICLKIVQLSSSPSTSDPQELTNVSIRLFSLPRESWSHVFLTIFKSNHTVRVCLNGQTTLTRSHTIPPLYSSNPGKPWSISLGQQSLDVCTPFYYDLGSILLFDKMELSEFVPTYLYSLGSDHWHFQTGSQQQQTFVHYWIYQRFVRVHSLMPIDRFELEENTWQTILKRSFVASYSSNNPWTLFLFKTSLETNDDVAPRRLNKILPFRTSFPSPSSFGATSSDENLLTTTTTVSLPSKISLEQSSNLLNICEQLGGILNFIYLFGKIIEINAYQSPSCICDISDIVFTSIWKIKSYYDLFNSLDGYCLIVKILTTNECTHHISNAFYEILLEKCLLSNQQRLSDINLFRYFLLDWKIWCNHPKIFHTILNVIHSLLSDQSNPKYFFVNRQLFKSYFTLEHLLILCQEIIDEQQQIIIDRKLGNIIVSIIEALVENDINIIALLMNFVLITHPLVKMYVTYNKEHFYFLTKSFDYYQQREKYRQENRAKHLIQKEKVKLSNRQYSTAVIKEEEFESSTNSKDNSNLRKSQSFSDLLSSTLLTTGSDTDLHSNRRTYHITVSGIASSKTFSHDRTPSINKDSPHNVDYLSTGILRLLTDLALTTSDRLMVRLIDHVFRLNILTVLLLGASMSKRVQCLRLLDNVLNRMDTEKVQADVLRMDLHTMLANQIYHQLDGLDDEKELVEVCVSIALQRPTEFNTKLSLAEQTHDAEQFYSILASSPPCPRSQVGLALVLSLVEKLSVTNPCLCELILHLLDAVIRRSTDENRYFLVDIGLTQVLFNTLSSAIVTSQDRLISSVQKCFYSLIIAMFQVRSHTNDDISFISIMNNIIGVMMTNTENHDEDSIKDSRRIFHQTLSNMFNTIIDSIEKSSLTTTTVTTTTDISSYQSAMQRSTIDDNHLNSNIVENSDRFRKFLQLALDYIYLFHHECALFETFTLRLLDICLLGIAYLIEKRSNHVSSRDQMSLIVFRCGDIIKQIGQKLLTVALDPEKQRFFFRIQVLKHLIDQPNARAILEYLLTNDNQGYIYHQILIYLQNLSNTTPTHDELDQLINQHSNQTLSELSRKSIDSGQPTRNVLHNVSNGEESSSHTVNIITKSKKHVEMKTPRKRPSATDEERDIIPLSSPSSTSHDEQEILPNKIFNRSSSPSPSISSVESELPTLQQSPITNYQNIISLFRDLMRMIHIPSLTTNDSQRRALTEFLLTTPSATLSQTLRNSSRGLQQRHSFDWSASASSPDAQTLPNNYKSISPDRFRRRRRSQLSPSSPSPVVISWTSVVDEKRLEYSTLLRQTIEAIQKRSTTSQRIVLQTFTDSTISTIRTRAMEITQDVVNLQGFERKKFLEYLRSTQSLDLRTKHLWHQLICQLTHEYGVWFEAISYPKFWELDPTENPQRERRRLQRSYCLMEKRFFQSQVPDEILVNPPLSYLFDTRQYQSMSIQTILYQHERLEYQCRCTNVTLTSEVKGELLVGTTRIYFVADDQLTASTKNKRVNSAITTVGYNHHSFNNDSNSFSFAIEEICEMQKRRYMLKEVALELFFINGITLMIAHVSQNDRENLHQLLTKRCSIHVKQEEKVWEIQNHWKQGRMNNFDYLMQLNKLAGRSFLDLMQYPIYPYIVSNYESTVLDLRLPSNYRNLSRPIAVQHPDKEEKIIELYNALQDLYNAAREQQADLETKVVSSALGHQPGPYHFSSLYSNSGVVLHYLVRLLPYTRLFLDYQGNSLDCADRTFHDVKTSYWLSSFESTSDCKELIPEFYYFHDFLINKQGVDFGRRQNGEPVSDVSVPTWAKRNARLFVYGLRQALESDYVTTHLHQWIDLIFGYKQTDKAAIDAVNVYPAGCYYGFPVERIDDHVLQGAYYTVIRNYGQVPKQLFPQAHPAISANSFSSSSLSNSSAADKRNSERQVFESKLPPESIHRLITGVRWGDFVGSYDMPSPTYISKHECAIQVFSFVTSNKSTCLLCLPSSSLIINHERLFYDSINEQMISSQVLLDSMIALKWNTDDGIVRCRQLKQQVKTWHNFLVPIDDQDKITCCASIDYQLLFFGKTSGLIEVYKIQRNKFLPTGIELIKRYLPFIAHRSPITCLYANQQFSLLISASADGMLTLWDTNRLSYVRTYKQDNQTIYHLISSESTGDIAYLSSSGSQWHLSYLTCNCDFIGCLTFSEQLNCLCFTSANEGTSVNVLLGGFENGLILMWSTWDLTLLRQLDYVQLHSHSIVAICVPKFDRRRLYVADRDRYLHTIESRLSSSTSSTQAPSVLFLS